MWTFKMTMRPVDGSRSVDAMQLISRKYPPANLCHMDHDRTRELVNLISSAWGTFVPDGHGSHRREKFLPSCSTTHLIFPKYPHASFCSPSCSASTDSVLTPKLMRYSEITLMRCCNFL